MESYLKNAFFIYFHIKFFGNKKIPKLIVICQRRFIDFDIYLYILQIENVFLILMILLFCTLIKWKLDGRIFFIINY